MLIKIISLKINLPELLRSDEPNSEWPWAGEDVLLPEQDTDIGEDAVLLKEPLVVKSCENELIIIEH